VLAGITTFVRTQIRLEEGFLGYETSAKNDVVRYIGVENARKKFVPIVQRIAR
jgi:hypothetical protein